MQGWLWLVFVSVIAEINIAHKCMVNAAFLPELSSINPSSGPNGGGFTVTVNGLFVSSQGQVLTNGATCQFGTSFVNGVIVNARTITCTAPSSSVGKTTFRVLVNNQQWSNTTLSFNYYSCSALSASSPCTSCVSLPMCGVCIPTMQCASVTSCSNGFVSKCPTITNISPSTASINGGTNMTVTFDVPIPQSMSYQCSYGSSIINTATPATVVSSYSLTCSPPQVTKGDWNTARGTNREVMTDLVIRTDSSVVFASKSSSITLFDCETYAQDCSTCTSAMTNGECSFCFDSQSCRYNGVSCDTSGSCISITSVTPSTVYISAVQLGQVMTVTGNDFSSFNGQSFECAFDAVGDKQSTSSSGQYSNASTVTCDIPTSLSVGSHSLSLWLYNSIAGAFQRVTPNFEFSVYDCSTKSCTQCLDDTRSECVYCSNTASCGHVSSSCSSTKITSVPSCPSISVVAPSESPLAGGVSISVNGTFDTSVLSDPSSVRCVWAHEGTNDTSIASVITENSVQCTAPTVSHPVTGSVSLTALGNIDHWTNSLPFSWFDCSNITSSCNECVRASASCEWCITHCSTSCRGASHSLSVCPTITSISPSIIRANSDAQQVIKVIGGPFFDDIELACLFGSLTTSAVVINESTVECTAPVYLSDDTTLALTAYGQIYTNTIDVDVQGCSSTNVSMVSVCSSQCTSQPHCGWCVASGTCTTTGFCASSDVLLDECLDLSISPSVFGSELATTVNITVSPRVPQVWFSAKRTSIVVAGLYCSLSTGHLIPAIITSETTLECELPSLTDYSSTPVTLALTFHNQTLTESVTLETVDCGSYGCEDCPSSACVWCCMNGCRCGVAYNCLYPYPDGCGSEAPPMFPPQVLYPLAIIPSVGVAVGITLLIVLLLRRKRRKARKQKLTDTNYTSIEIPTHGKSNIVTTTVPLSINQKMEIPFASLEMKREIGSGSYGKVFLGQWQGAKVAIKVCASMANIDGFFDEATLTIALPPHPNVVQTFGISVDGALPCIVLEYCGGGSLDKKIFNRDATYSFEDQVRLIKGIARGLLHLHTNNIVHRDLAARNILLTRGGKPKISDFGMSRLLKEESQKGQTKSTVGPLKWMAPESIRDTSYSTKSDVWTFGLLMYEILSGSEPHADMDLIDVAAKIKNENYHPEIPAEWNEQLQEIMLSCWDPEPNQRPTMQDIAKQLQERFETDDDSDS